MHYLGGKYRLAPKFVHILAVYLVGRGTFVEPFTGGFNLVPALRRLRIPDIPARAVCGELHPGLVSLYRGLQAGTFDPPHTLTEETYHGLRQACDWDDPLTAFAAFACSFGGKEWGGFARNADGRNYAAVGARFLRRKAAHMAGVKFSCVDYRDVPILPGDVVYADPPYVNTAQYKVGPFDHREFYEWCEATARAGASVFVSEFTIPDRPGWVPAWSVDRYVAIEGKTQSGKPRRDYLVEVIGAMT